MKSKSISYSKKYQDIFVLWEIASTFLMGSVVVFSFAFLVFWFFLQHLDGISKFIEYDFFFFFAMTKESPPVLGKSHILDD